MKLPPVFALVRFNGSCNKIWKNIVDCENVNWELICLTWGSCMSDTHVWFKSWFFNVVVNGWSWESSVDNKTFVSCRNSCLSLELLWVGLRSTICPHIYWKSARRNLAMRHSIRNEISAIFCSFLIIVGELEYGMLESRVNLVAQRVPSEQIIASAHIERQFLRLAGRIEQRHCKKIDQNISWWHQYNETFIQLNPW